ncbi:LacI family DNA-binding transcriptional regulator [Pedobacter sp. AW31-3R]|uniref:LacI family DNA-binding transcriptional regulator n=1 Tax=Pedobacter sp. AW31-3R TaxID=3445781 RepID=UPI003FA00223
MKKKLAIKDIAEQLKISKTAVSFVLNGKARAQGISVVLEKRILDFIEKVGYKPSRMAQGLRTGKSNTIGMMVEDISDPFFSSIARRVEEVAYDNGYRIVFGSTDNDTIKSIDLIQLFRNHQVDGYIIAPSPGLDNEIQELINDGLPVVVFDRKSGEAKCDAVVVDNYDGTRKAILHLIENGYKNIAMITIVSEQHQMLDRLNAYQDLMDKYERPHLLKRVVFHVDKQKGIDSIQRFLEANKEVDAVFFATSYMAITGLQALKKMGRKVPQDIAVIAFDDYSSFDLFNPSITAICQPIQQISDEVINTMLNKLMARTEIAAEAATTVLETALLIRESSAPKEA